MSHKIKIINKMKFEKADRNALFNVYINMQPFNNAVDTSN